MSGILEGRVAIITGAGSGLGAAHARVFAAQGCAVVVNDINTEAAQAVVAEITASGGTAVANQSDITNYDDSLNAVKQALDTFGGLHIVLNNAGINRDRMFASMTEQEWDAIMSVHLKGHKKAQRSTHALSIPPPARACRALSASPTMPPQKPALPRSP